MKKTQKGFTLVELIVVIAIIGILAAILVPSMMGYVKKSKLKSANSNAKLVFTTVNGAIADLTADGNMTNINSGTFSGSVGAMSAQDGYVGNEVDKALSDNGTGAGVVLYSIKSDKTIEYAQWANTTSSGEIVGQYPDPEDDYTVTHQIGSKFS